MKLQLTVSGMLVWLWRYWWQDFLASHHGVRSHFQTHPRLPSLLPRQTQTICPTVTVYPFFLPDLFHSLSLTLVTVPHQCQRQDFPPTTTQPNAGSGKDIPEGGKGESERRGCRLPELRERGYVTAGLQLQLVCYARVPSLVVLNLRSHSKPIRGEWRADAPMRRHRVSPRELRRFGDDRGGRYSTCLGTSQIDSE